MNPIHHRIVLVLPLVMGWMLFRCVSPLEAQNAPVTTLATVGNAVPGPVVVPVTVTGFNNIGAISLTIDYAYAGLHFVGGSPHPQLGGFAVGDQDLGNGRHRVTMGWFGSGASLADGSVIMSLTFTYISGITALEFYDSGPSCEYADGAFNVLNDIPQGAYYINGLVCGQVPAPGPIIGDASVCIGETGVAYSIQPVVNATGYAWTVPAGVAIITGNNTNAITVDYSGSASSGLVTVAGSNGCGSGPFSTLPVTVNGLPVANAGPDQSIPYGTNTMLVAASGGSGAFGYHWSPEALLVNPDLQNAQTVNLTATTLFSLQVTNLATLCVNTDETIVTITGGPLTATPVADPGMICRGTPSQLYANAGGGSGNYSYSWSCTPPGTPPWSSFQANPVVFPDSTKVYHLTLSDGFNAVQASVQVMVNQLPSGHIEGGDTLCGAGGATPLTVTLTGTPPWSIWYSNGVTTWNVENLFTTPYIISATEAGTYTLLAMADSHCTGNTSGSAVVAVFPFPPTPVITVNGNELFSSGCCGNQWYKEGVAIPGATGQVYAPVETAHYFDIVTVNGCASDTSNTIYFLMEGIGEGDHGGISLYPNPARGSFTILTAGKQLSVSGIRIMAMTGERVAKFTFRPHSSLHGLKVDVSGLAPGIFLLEILTDTGSLRKKLVIR